MFLSAMPTAGTLGRWHLCASVSVGEPISVGAVDKVQAQVEATQAGQPVRWVSNRKSISGIDTTAEKARASRRR